MNSRIICILNHRCCLLTILWAHLIVVSVRASSDQPDSTIQTNNCWSVAAAGNMSYLIPKGPYAGAILHSYATSYLDLRIKRQADSHTTDPYERQLNLPTLEAGLLFGDFSHIHMHKGTIPYESRIGRIWALYGGLQYDFVRNGKWRLGTDLQNGVAYCPHPFDEQTNYDNELIGAPLSIFVNIGLFAHCQLSSDWSVALGIDFKHFSNGSLQRPNLGVNTIGPTLSVEHALPSKTKVGTTAPRQEDANDYTKGFYIEVLAGFGLKTLLDHFNVYHSNNCPVYGFFTTTVAPMYRYHRIHASGLALDYTYADYVYRQRDFDKIFGRSDERYSPHILGISLRHEVFYHHCSLAVGVGTYLSKQTGYLGRTEDGRFFQNIGLRYSFPFTSDRLFIGYNIKAHRFSKADCSQLILGLRL